MGECYIRNKEENTIYEYFPNQRMPSSVSVEGNERHLKTIEEYCIFIWEWEAMYWNYSRFIFTHGWKQ